MRPNEEDKIPILSFFSGGGFLDMGFEKAGFEVVFSNEIDEDFARFYEEGMSSWSKRERKISAVCSIDKILPHQLPVLGKKPFGIIGGPPCQDFSIQGSKAGFDGLRGTLTFSFYEKIMELQPDFFLMENVPGLVLLKNTKKIFEALLDLFGEDYEIQYKCLNSLHFAIPQKRERLFVFGVKKNRERVDTFLSKKSFRWPEPIYPEAESAFSWGEPEGKIGKTEGCPSPPEELCVESILLKKAEMELPNAKDFFKLKNLSKSANILEGDTYRPSFKRLHRKKYSPTACYGNNEVHLHPVENRRLTVRETLRLQGIPDEYILTTPGKLSKKFKMIGNGVPMPLAYNIAWAIKKYILNNTTLLKQEIQTSLEKVE